MTDPRLRLPSPALVLSCVAMFTALGGGAYAATTLSQATMQWHNATMLDGWTRLSPSAPAGYAKDSNGVVHLRGGIQGGTTDAAAFRLPVGYRPSHELWLLIYTQDGVPGALTITPAGLVIPFGQNANQFSSLDGVSFAAGE